MSQKEVDALEAEYRRRRAAREALDEGRDLAVARVKATQRAVVVAEALHLQAKQGGSADETIATSRERARAQRAAEEARAAAGPLERTWQAAKEGEDQALRDLSTAQEMLARGE